MNDSRTDAEPLAFLVGPTASGKTELALELAEQAGAALLSMDSMLVYRGMDIGTAKPTPAEQKRVPHRGLDLADPPERYDVQRYLADAEAALREIRSLGRPVLVCGGTGFYLQALVFGLFEGPPADLEIRAALKERALAEGSAALHAELERVDPPSAQRIHPNDEKRVIRALEVREQTGKPLSDWQAEWGWQGEAPAGRPRRIVGLEVDRGRLDERIRARTRQMLDDGWVEEACAIRDGVGFGPTSIQALGYREVLELADGRATREETFELVALRTRQFARRQRTWFRRFPEICWIDPEAADAFDQARAGLEVTCS